VMTILSLMIYLRRLVGLLRAEQCVDNGLSDRYSFEALTRGANPAERFVQVVE
jgi:hypothetical protein